MPRLQALPSPNEAKLVAEIQQLENKLEKNKLLLAQVRSASGSGSGSGSSPADPVCNDFVNDADAEEHLDTLFDRVGDDDDKVLCINLKYSTQYGGTETSVGWLEHESNECYKKAAKDKALEYVRSLCPPGKSYCNLCSEVLVYKKECKESTNSEEHAERVKQTFKDLPKPISEFQDVCVTAESGSILVYHFGCFQENNKRDVNYDDSVFVEQFKQQKAVFTQTVSNFFPHAEICITTKPIWSRV
jgi:hypothetical protein